MCSFCLEKPEITNLQGKERVHNNNTPALAQLVNFFFPNDHTQLGCKNDITDFLRTHLLCCMQIKIIYLAIFDVSHESTSSDQNEGKPDHYHWNEQGRMGETVILDPSPILSLPLKNTVSYLTSPQSGSSPSYILLSPRQEFQFTLHLFFSFFQCYFYSLSMCTSIIIEKFKETKNTP